MLTDQQQSFARVLDLIEDAGCMRHLALIGSWAEFAYREAGLLPGFSPSIKTMDVDFLVRNLRRPTPAASLASLAKERGFFVESDRLTSTTKILDTAGLEVKFLIGKKGAGIEPSLKTNIGVTAQALRHTDVLARNLIEIPCLGHLVNAPIPEAYAAHKMIINEERGKKAEKDAAAIANIYKHLDQAKLSEILAMATKKERARALKFIDRYTP